MLWSLTMAQRNWNRSVWRKSDHYEETANAERTLFRTWPISEFRIAHWAVSMMFFFQQIHENHKNRLFEYARNTCLQMVYNPHTYVCTYRTLPGSVHFSSMVAFNSVRSSYTLYVCSHLYLLRWTRAGRNIRTVSRLSFHAFHMQFRSNIFICKMGYRIFKDMNTSSWMWYTHARTGKGNE